MAEAYPQTLRNAGGRPVYTFEERARRDATRWTLVQGVLAPLQFVVFLVSLGLIVRYLLTGEGWAAASLSVVLKTLVLYLIMVTGAIWEKVVFGRYLFAHSFFWEDAVSMVVIALHTICLVAWFSGDAWLAPQTQMLVALAAYAAYVVNAAQFLFKLRRARLERAQ
jgi:3-vinyl bacteriochlorophyllide hydratase